MHNINFSVKPGQKVAIVGSTGAGKTTLINLLMRFYELNGGKITLDAVDTKDMTRSLSLIHICIPSGLFVLRTDLLLCTVLKDFLLYLFRQQREDSGKFISIENNDLPACDKTFQYSVVI